MNKSCAAWAAMALVALAGATPLAQAANTPAVGFTGVNGSFLDGNNRVIGWQFSVPQPVSAVALGWFDLGQDGLATSHQVGIWNSATHALLASATVAAGTAAPLQGYFRYTELETPLLLQQGVSYRIAGFDPGGGDAHVWTPALGGFNAHVNGFSTSPAITLGASGTAIGIGAGAFQYPSQQINDSRTALMGPNMLLAPVPEPGTVALMVGGLLLVGAVAKGRGAVQRR